MFDTIEVLKTIAFSLSESVLEIVYLLASILFIMGLKKLSAPDTARAGNLWAAFGMGLAIVATIFLHQMDGKDIGNKGLIFLSIGLGTFAGWSIATKVKMTAMPQLVSLFNGMGGAAAALISLLEFPHLAEGSPDGTADLMSGHVLAILLGLVIGSVSFAGSMVAYGKLDGKINEWRSPALRYINMGFLLAIFGTIGWLMSLGSVPPANAMFVVYGIFAASLLYGVFFVMPIGGADMPVVISLLNSFTGMAAAMGGFLYDNQAMLTGGILVGSAGTILTILMCNAMNRSLTNVIIGAFGGTTGESQEVEGTMKETNVSDAAIQLFYAQKVVIVPGYGMAVGNAQHACRELEKMLAKNGVDVSYAIHPVAGRMPGHMNVLLAEADVPYEKMHEMDEANPDMPNVDVVMVIGANDVVNPAAEDDKNSPIYGMPIIQAHNAKNIIVLKRGKGKGYAAIENALFFNDKTKMLFGDAKDSLQKLVSEVKGL